MSLQATYMDSPCSRAVELAEVYPLPGPKNEPSALNRYQYRLADECRFGMRGGVPLRVTIRTCPGYQAVKDRFHIVHYRGVRVFVYGHTGGGVGDIDHTGTLYYSCF